MKAKKQQINGISAVEHNENGTTAFINKDHSGQKHYRDSKLIPVTVPFYAKMQKKYGVNAETIDGVKCLMLLGKEAGIDFVESDFDRSKDALIKTETETETVQNFKKMISEGLKSSKKKTEVYLSHLKIKLADLKENKTITETEQKLLLKWFSKTFVENKKQEITASVFNFA